MTPPIYVESAHEPVQTGPSAEELLEPITDRLTHVESEIGHLRDTLGRFGELVLRELKRLHPETTETVPVVPPEPKSTRTEAVPAKPRITLALPGPVQNIIGTVTIPRGLPSFQGWVIVDLYRELKSILGMFFDPRYTVRRVTQLTLLVVILLVLGNYFFWSMLPVTIPFVFAFLEKCVDAVLVLGTFLLLRREMLRYREHLTHYTRFENANHTHKEVIYNEDSPHSQMDIEE